jgi:hypothetical protein
MDMARLITAEECNKRCSILWLSKTANAFGLHTLSSDIIDTPILITRPCLEKLLQALSLRLTRINPIHIYIILKALTR